MTNACPNALSLAVAVAISSSMMGTQALADRRLQTKSIDIQSNGHAEFIQSEVMVQPTLGDDQQPIPKSFTTTYPDQSQRSTDYAPPSMSFTAVLSGIDSGVYSVDHFETDKNNVAQKYTKVLKVADEGVFRFTHNLDKKVLHIEVRGGMTDPDSIEAVRAQLGCVPSLEPFTKIATPLQLAFLLEGVDDRAGSLGRSDHYVALASIEVEKVEVNGRTFMRLIAAGDQPPELQSLGQSLFVNDEALLTAAASAYIQVHVLGEDLQQQALNDLLAYSKPVGYVVHAEDDTEVYPVPPGYPKLEVTEAPGEVIVFHGQKQNPHDIAFVENLYKLWIKAWLNNRTSAAATRVNKYKVKSYQYVIRSRQMELLDQFANQLAAHPNAELNEDQLMMLADYESLQQALSSATPDAADEFQLAIRHIKVAESIITSPWIQVQLAKHFGFKPALRNLLTNEHFLKEFMSIVNGEAANAFDYDEEFASKIVADMTRQILERESRQKELQTKEVRLAQLKKLYHLKMDKANPNDEEQLTTQRHYQNIEGELAEVRVKLEDLKNQERKLQREVKRIPELEQQVRDARKEASNHYNAQFAKELGIVNWDDTQPQKEQARRITGKLNEIFRAVAATKQPEEEAVKTNLAAIEAQLGIAPDNENDLDARFQSIQRHLQQKEKLTDEAIWNRLIVIDQLGEQHLQHLQKLKKQKNWLQELQQELDRTPALRREVRDPIEKTITDYYVQLAEGLGISNWVVTEPFEEQARLIRKNIHKIRRSGKSRKKAVIEKLAAVEGKYNIFPNNENDLEARFQSIEQHLQQHLQQQTELIEGVIRNRLANFEVQLGLVPGDEEQMAYRQDLIRQHLRQQIDQVDQDYLRQQSIRTGAEKIAATKARFATIAKHLNIQNFDDNEDIETQQKRLIQRIQTLNTHAAKEETFVKLRQEAMATVLGLELNEDSTLEDRQELIEHRQLRLYRLADFEKELEHISVSGHPITTLSELEDVLQDIRTPGHPRFKPEVLDKLSAVEEALEMKELNSEDDEYYRRQAISRDIQTYISEARERAEEDAQDVLRAVEEILGINANESDDKGKRLDRILAKLADDEVTEKKLSDIHNVLWGEEDFTPGNSIAKVRRLSERLSLYVMDSDLRATTQQTRLLKAIEDELGIDRNEHIAAKERGKNFVAKLADDLKIDIVKDASLNNQKAVLKARFQALDDAVSKPCDDEGVRRGIHNEIAYQLGIQGYRDDAPADDQTHLIKEKLQQLNKAVFMAGWPKFNERIAAINAELDRLMACLGPKPRYVLDREVAKAKSDTEKANSELEKLRRKLDAVHRKQVVIAHPDDVHPDTDKVITALNQVMKHIHTELGLTQDDNHTPEDRLDDIERFLQKEDDAVRRVETVQKLRDTIKELKIPFKNDPDNLSEADHIKAIREYTASHGRDKVDQAVGELPETRRKHAQVRKFLHEYDLRAMELANAQDEEKQAREALDTKNQAIGHSKDINPKAKTQLERSREVLDLVLEQKKAITSEAQEALKAHEAKLKAIEDHVGLKPAPTARYADRVDVLRNKQVEMGGLDGTGGKILQLTQKQDRLNRQIEVRTAEIEQLKEVLKAAEKAVENEGGPFQYTPKQANILTDIYAFVQSHPLKKQALEAVMGLAESAELSGKLLPNLQTFDLDDEFAPIRLQALAGNQLTFDQSRRIVEVFKSLQTTFTMEPEEGRSLNPLGELQKLADSARAHIKTGPQQYDDEIRGMGAAAIHYVAHESGNLKSFSEYFATHSASGNRMIALLHEGLISEIELEHYMKAVRGVDGYQTVTEFEHFLGDKHGVRVPEFRKVIQMLSDEGIEQFIQNVFTPVAVTSSGPMGMKESVAGMKEYAAAVIANYVLDDIAFENGRRTLAFLANIQDTLTPYANAAGMSESDLIKIINSTLMQAHAVAVEQQLNDYWVKPSAFLAQTVTWYFSSYKPLLSAHNTLEATLLSLSNMSFLYLLDLTNRGDYLHRILTPFRHWIEHYGVDFNRNRQYAYHSGIEQVSELGGLAMPLGRTASSIILLKTGSMLFTRQYNANPHRYRSLFRLVPEMVKSMGSGQGVKVPLLHRITPAKVKTMASATAGLVLGPIATAGAYVHGLISGFTYAQTFGLALTTSLTFDFFMNDNKMLTQWLGGPLGRSLDRINRWREAGETESDYVKRTAITTPQRFSETDEAYANRVKANNMMHGWTRGEHYLQFRERRDRTMKMYEHGWEKYFRKNVPEWSFSHAESIPYSYTLGALFEWQKSSNKKLPDHDRKMLSGKEDKETSDEL